MQNTIIKNIDFILDNDDSGFTIAICKDIYLNDIFFENITSNHSINENAVIEEIIDLGLYTEDEILKSIRKHTYINIDGNFEKEISDKLDLLLEDAVSFQVEQKLELITNKKYEQLLDNVKKSLENINNNEECLFVPENTEERIEFLSNLRKGKLV